MPAPSPYQARRSRAQHRTAAALRGAGGGALAARRVVCTARAASAWSTDACSCPTDGAAHRQRRAHAIRARRSRSAALETTRVPATQSPLAAYHECLPTEVKQATESEGSTLSGDHKGAGGHCGAPPTRCVSPPSPARRGGHSVRTQPTVTTTTRPRAASCHAPTRTYGARGIRNALLPRFGGASGRDLAPDGRLRQPRHVRHLCRAGQRAGARLPGAGRGAVDAARRRHCPAAVATPSDGGDSVAAGGASTFLTCPPRTEQRARLARCISYVPAHPAADRTAPRERALAMDSFVRWPRRTDVADAGLPGSRSQTTYTSVTVCKNRVCDTSGDSSAKTRWRCAAPSSEPRGQNRGSTAIRSETPDNMLSAFVRRLEDMIQRPLNTMTRCLSFVHLEGSTPPPHVG